MAGKILDVRDIATAVGKYAINNLGINVKYVDHATEMLINFEWYRGKTDWHKFQVYNGIKHIQCERKTLNMAKVICEDWASLLMNEKNKYTVEDEEAQEDLNKTLDDNDFVNNARLLIELAFGLGGGAFIERYDTEENKKKIDFIHGDLIFPLKWENGKIIDCGFATIGANLIDGENTINFITYTYENFNNENQYVIRETQIDRYGSIVNQDNLLDAGVELINGKFKYEIETHSNVPLFQYIKPNKINTNDKTSPYGASIYANCIDTLKQIDEDYDAIFNEVNIGKKKLIVRSGLTNISVENLGKTDINAPDEEDRVQGAIDVNDTIYYALGDEWENGKPPVYATEWQLNIESLKQALNVNLDILSNSTGFGIGFYNFNGTLISRTATEVISVNSKLYKTLRKHESVLKKAVKGMIKGLMLLANIHENKNYDLEQNISVDFDDSILEDTAKKRQDLLALYNSGLIDKVEFFAEDRFDGDRELATKFINEMEESNTMRDMSMLSFGGSTFDDGVDS